jgi:hypothetical protein
MIIITVVVGGRGGPGPACSYHSGPAGARPAGARNQPLPVVKPDSAIIIIG